LEFGGLATWEAANAVKGKSQINTAVHRPRCFVTILMWIFIGESLTPGRPSAIIATSLEELLLDMRLQ